MRGDLMMFQDAWGWYIAIYLFLGGMGGGGMLVSYYLQRRTEDIKVASRAALLSWIIVVVGTLFLILDLGRPERFYLVFMSPKLNPNSMIVVGSSILTLYMIFGALYITAIHDWFKFLPWYGKKSFANVMGIISASIGFLVTYYTGVLIGVVKQIPFWHTPALPLLFIASAISTGVVAVLWTDMAMGIRLPFEERKHYIRNCAMLSRWDSVLIAIELLILFTYLAITIQGPQEAAIAVNRILFGDLAIMFVGGVILMGLGVPLLLEYAHIMRESEETETKTTRVRCKCLMPIIAGILVVAGGLILRYVVLAAGANTIFLPP